MTMKQMYWGEPRVYIGGPAPAGSGYTSGHDLVNPGPTSGGFGNSILYPEPEYDYLPGGGGQYQAISADSSDGSGEIQMGGGNFAELNPDPVYINPDGTFGGGTGGFGDVSATESGGVGVLPGDGQAISADSSDGSHQSGVEEIPVSGGFGDALLESIIGYGPEMQQERDDMPPEGSYIDPNMIRPGTPPSGVAYQLALQNRDTGGTYYTNAGQFGASLARRHGFGQGVVYV